jgi:alkylhydroperoxidase family enzyme
MAFIEPPRRLSWWLRLSLWYAQRAAGADLLVGRLLAWYPKAALSSGVLESLIAHHDGQLDERLLKLVRMQVSYTAACPFCIAMNGQAPERYHISEDEIAALRGLRALDDVATFSPLERVALTYARLISQTPLRFPTEFVTTLKEHFSEREIVILATTAAQVNYWTRLIQALGAPPTG